MADFNELTVGYSISGAEEYIQNLNAKAIDETKDIIRGERFTAVKTAMEAGWVGQSEVNFMAKLKNGSEQLCDSLDEIRRALNDMMSSIEEEMAERDKKIVDEVM